MNLMQMCPGKFYEIFKVHKSGNQEIPAEKLIVSTCETFTERIGQYVQPHLKLVLNMNSYFLQDYSQDFLRAIEDEINANNLI